MADRVKPSQKLTKSRVNEAETNYTKPGLRKSIFNRIKAGGKGGAPGQWSARKAQMMAKEYKSKGRLQELMAKHATQKSLSNWTKEEWGTKSGKNSTQGSKATGERYLPKKARAALSDKEYARSTAKKRASMRKGEQHSKQPDDVAKKTARHRS